MTRRITIVRIICRNEKQYLKFWYIDGKLMVTLYEWYTHQNFHIQHHDIKRIEDIDAFNLKKIKSLLTEDGFETYMKGLYERI